MATTSVATCRRSHLSPDGGSVTRAAVLRLAADAYDLAKQSPRNDGRMKDASGETLVLPEDLSEQFYGKQFRKSFDGKSTKDSLKPEAALTPRFVPGTSRTPEAKAFLGPVAIEQSQGEW